MKLFRICGYFKLPDDFAGTADDAMRLLAEYYVNSPPVTNAKRVRPESMTMWSATWPDAAECFSTSERRFSGSADMVGWDGSAWYAIPDPATEAAKEAAIAAGTYERRSDGG